MLSIFIFYSTGISKTILVKGGHGLENVRLNLIRVMISWARTIGLPHLFYESQSQFCETHEQGL
jgi:hypothetical protein